MSLFKKYRKAFLITGLIVFPYLAIRGFYQYAIYKDGMGLIGGIVFSGMTLFYVGDLYTYYKNRRTEKILII